MESIECIPTLVRAIPAGIEVDTGGRFPVVWQTQPINGTSFGIDRGPDNSVTGVYVDDAKAIPALVHPSSPLHPALETFGSPDTIFYKSVNGRSTGEPIARLGNFLDTQREIRLPEYAKRDIAARDVNRSFYDGVQAQVNALSVERLSEPNMRPMPEVETNWMDFFCRGNTGLSDEEDDVISLDADPELIEIEEYIERRPADDTLDDEIFEIEELGGVCDDEEDGWSIGSIDAEPGIIEKESIDAGMQALAPAATREPDEFVLYDRDLEEVVMQDDGSTVIDERDMLDVFDLTRVVSYTDDTRIVPAKEYADTRAQLFALDTPLEDIPELPMEFLVEEPIESPALQAANTAVSREPSAFDLLKQACDMSYETLGLKVEEVRLFDGSDGFLVKHVTEDNPEGWCVPEMYAEDAFAVMGELDDALERYDRFTTESIPGAQTAIIQIKDLAGRDDSQVTRVMVKQKSEQELTGLVREAAALFNELLRVKEETGRYFTKPAAKDAKASVDERLDTLSSVLFHDAALGRLDQRTEDAVYRQMAADVTSLDLAVSAKAVRKLLSDPTFENVNKAARISEKLSDESFYHRLSAKIEETAKELGYEHLGKTLESEGLEGMPNLINVYHASGRKGLNEVGKYARRFHGWMQRGGWLDMQYARATAEEQFTGKARSVAVQMADKRLDSMAYTLALPIAEGSCIQQGIYFTRDEKKAVYDELVRSGKADRAALAMGIASRNFPQLMKPTLQHLGTCLESELYAADQDPQTGFLDHREKVAGILDGLECMFNDRHRKDAQEYVHIIAQSYMRGGKPRLVGGRDPAEDRDTLVGIPVPRERPVKDGSYLGTC
ncbi:hypothetical protein KY362_08240 [Candidatus Woesearchaeota archaeon]|nr:hypothetical protein [Candidatus Woesearchaeota archaeon]